MPGAYHQLLDATIGHLESLKQRGVRYVDASPESLSLLAEPAAQERTATPTSQAASTIIVQRHDEPSVYDSPKLTAADKEFAMTKLRHEALACTQCEPLVATRTQVVFGVGTVHADLMLIGEAPGLDEDKEGEPFVGAAGQLLTKIIEATGLDRDKVYIANILKCRPDTPGKIYGNRKPRPEEMETCFPWVKRQIEIIQPKVMVALGGTAVEGLLGEMPSGITRMRGNWQAYRGVPVMPTFHPSYLLRNQSWTIKRHVWEDMMQVMERLNMPISEKQRSYFQRR
ncbi:MAG: uracil-DNA glycosylase [Verrucomicrobia bacterium]|nr:uracil-DNA glycosylase [Verrucomicrobiota bacterium]MBT5311383.1 uracil-DNA glycosylase [Verrucomicrobiota bacterium]MBT7911082.1 uracil-DNA glycosylase [Verrucomicrobiota bacterium]